ncbi:hypothetical protein CCAX7_50230 [Capsulimonas corticalis]|uniref:Uncharacterized protein n=1 Tax=Capsulimonas corticalis TaxID=2219043 RepID=A0A402CPF5_9BACT|nr:prepilin-type N-terminal cleavage/methylation domain-containing protein [Capsulimonas corticalis]BDI32972.1 hypothetical protein CCAX7_50230 [Capsulimonas corticalis]
MKKSCRQTSQAFSLIELLVVIAIIALLAAIIFPVFNSAREKGRQATVISNLKAISKGIADYRLANRSAAPPVLFGYAVPAALTAANPTASGPPFAPMGSAYGIAKAAGLSNKYFPGLYPRYINDVSVFTDPNNTAAPDAVTQKTVNLIGTDGSLTPQSATFYTADAYDLNPKITGASATDDTNLIVRYQPAWVPLTGPGALSPGDYARQPIFPSPPGDTYITSSTYHVKNQNKVIVLFQSGNVKVLDASVFDDNGGNFWKLHR